MRAVRTPATNVTLVLPGGTERNELPAQRIMVYDPELGETEEDAHPALESVWQLTPEERRKIIGGAAVELIVRGDAHPPVSMNIGAAAVDLDQAIMDVGHIGRALSRLYAILDQRIEDAILQMQRDEVPADDLVDTGGDINPEAVGLPDAETFIRLWEECVAQTNREIAPGSNGRPDASA